MSNIDTVRASMDAYRNQDLEAATRLLAKDFTFTSPQDDHVDKSAYLERWFPKTQVFFGGSV